MHIPDNPNLVEVAAIGLKPGMYVAELDRPWLETPFATQGFLVREQADIEYVSQHCTFVYVDPAQAVTVDLNEKRFDPRTVKQTANLKQEFVRAKIEFESAAQAMDKVFSQIRTGGKVDVGAIQHVVNPLIDGVFRNHEAVAALTRMKGKEDYLFQHSLSTAIWSAVIGKQIGLAKAELGDLVLGTILMDVGMTELPADLLNKKGKLDTQEIQVVKQHVSRSLQIVKASNDLGKDILNVISCHHERHDGSGYPNGLVGAEIPLYARIAGLADSYDAMISNRPHSVARSSFEAVQELSDMGETLFQGSLVEQFVQAVGLFPTGSIVELNTGEVGIVIQQNQTRRLRPKVVLVLDNKKEKRGDMSILDLSECDVRNGTPLQWIARELRAGDYGIKPDDYYL